VTRGYRFFDHTADFGLEIFGDDALSLFYEAAKALFDLITAPAAPGRCDQRHIEVSGQDWADLMVNWLRELLYLWNGKSQLVRDIEMATVEETRLEAVLGCETYDPDRHEIRNEIKAVTYHQIEVGPFEDGWRARVVFDI
jgi:SHS2 domain-containing protein